MSIQDNSNSATRKSIATNETNKYLRGLNTTKISLNACVKTLREISSKRLTKEKVSKILSTTVPGVPIKLMAINAKKRQIALQAMQVDFNAKRTTNRDAHGDTMLTATYITIDLKRPHLTQHSVSFSWHAIKRLFQRNLDILRATRQERNVVIFDISEQLFKAIDLTDYTPFEILIPQLGPNVYACGRVHTIRNATIRAEPVVQTFITKEPQ